MRVNGKPAETIAQSVAQRTGELAEKTPPRSGAKSTMKGRRNGEETRQPTPRHYHRLLAAVTNSRHVASKRG